VIAELWWVVILGCVGVGEGAADGLGVRFAHVCDGTFCVCEVLLVVLRMLIVKLYCTFDARKVLVRDLPKEPRIYEANALSRYAGVPSS
jgi:hypothetical protein